MSDAARIEEVTSDWIVRREGEAWSDADEAALQAWLDESMAHKAAFWRMEHGWGAADRIGALGDMRSSTSNRVLTRRGATSAPWVIGASAIAAAVTLTVGLALHSRSIDPPVVGGSVALRTSVGGQRAVTLRDGSHIELNTATVLRTSEGSDGREVWLDRGEAFFDIAHRAGRPFVVHAGLRKVTVLGTRFSVRRDRDMVTVAVVSGRVRVDGGRLGADRSKAGSRAAVIGEGDIAIAQARGMLVAVAAPANVEAMTAWREGLLVFDHTRLGDAVADFNRYTTRPIRIDDPRTAEIRIGGAFRIDNSTGFLKLLHSAYGLTIRPEKDHIVVDP